MISTEQYVPGYHQATIIGKAAAEDAKSYIALRETHELVLNVARGWDGALDAFLRAFADVDVKRLTLFGPAGLDISRLGEMPKLRELNVAGRLVGDLNLDWFHKLHAFGFGAEIKGKQHVNLHWGNCEHLESTGMLGSKLPPMEVLAGFPKLKKIQVVKPKFNPREVLQLTHLQELDVSYWASLTAIAELDPLLTSITHLNLYRASRLLDYSAISRMVSLQYLNLEKCPDFPSAKLLEKLPELHEVYLIDMKIVDGDLQPFGRMPRLRKLGLALHKHYKPSAQEIVRQIEESAGNVEAAP